MGRPKGSKGACKTRKIRQLKFVQYHLDLVTHPDNVYALHLCCDAENRFGLGSVLVQCLSKPGMILSII